VEQESKENKVWVTVSYNVNLGNYESLKIESGYSQTLKVGEDPLLLIEEMQENISSIVIEEGKIIKKQLTKKQKRNND
jgi:hypothetical protein